MKKPKPRIKAVFEKVVGNGGNVTKAMREMKYSEGTINTPQKVTETKSWEMLLDEYLPESLIVKTHKEAFEAKRDGDKPDWQIRMKASELGYKVRGRLTDKSEVKITDLTGLMEVVYAPKKENKP